MSVLRWISHKEHKKSSHKKAHKAQKMILELHSQFL